MTSRKRPRGRCHTGAANGSPKQFDRKRSDTIDAACEADRRWFLAHPRATEYVRRGRRGEFAAALATIAPPTEGARGEWIVTDVRVVKLGPGLRAREPLMYFAVAP